MKKIADYTVITATDDRHMATQVNIAIAQGWQPLGGVSATTKNGVIVLVQAMVRYAAARVKHPIGLPV